MNFLSAYFFINIVFSMAATIGLIFLFSQQIKVLKLSSQQGLRLQYFLLLFSFVAIFCVPMLPAPSFEVPAQKSFSTVKNKIKKEIKNTTTFIYLKKKNQSSFSIYGVLSTFFLLVLSLKLLFLGWNYYKTFTFLKSQWIYKKVGHLTIGFGEDGSSPFSFSFLNQSFVFVPVKFMMNSRQMKLILKHEIQHIRQKDTMTLLLLKVLSRVLFCNPLVLFWLKKIDLQQELACDESVLNEESVSVQEYASCLFQVAQQQEANPWVPVGATGMLLGEASSQLSRRINMMRSERKKMGSIFMWSLLLVSFSLVSLTAFAFSNQSYHGKWTVAEVKKIVDVKDFSKGFPIEINEDVVRQLNRLTRTTGGKRYVRKALKNLKKHEAFIKKYIGSYQHPEELIAVPFIESQYQNLPPERNPVGAAGMWQFIEKTARAYGMQVDLPHIDERMDLNKETDAAMRYLGAVNLRFDDWGLALLSYYNGERRVQEAIDALGGNYDPWAVSRKVPQAKDQYLAKVVAAILILKYPELRN